MVLLLKAFDGGKLILKIELNENLESEPLLSPPSTSDDES